MLNPNLPKAGTADGSVFRSNLPLEQKLERARTELLDLSARNRLLNMPRGGRGARTIEMVDEQAAEIYRLLVREGRVFTFLPGGPAPGKEGGEQTMEESADVAELAQPDEDAGTDERGIAIRHADTRLQTRLTPAGLQRRLLDLYHDARTLEEEQGVNILFLALGTLRWVDPANASNIRHAPLILVPVSLERGNAGEKFKLRARAEDPAANLSLEAYLDRFHGLALPPFQSGDEFDPAAYVAAVAEAVAVKADWTVNPDDITLGFFSFAKFLMYRDLDPEVWPADSRICDQPNIRALLADGFAAPDELVPENAPIDPHIAPGDMLHIVDSDSSQTVAVHEVRQGRSIVIQGPPGTGKSQTIANIVASAVADGKTVLFVAEKMAALEVVKRRLDQAGVGDACLELHSNKASKRVVLDELRRTWELGAPRSQRPDTLARLTAARDDLNGHAARLHAPHPQAGLTAYQVIGQLTHLRQQGHPAPEVELAGAVAWSPDDVEKRRQLIAGLADQAARFGRPADHPWCAIGLDRVLPIDAERLAARIAVLAGQLTGIRIEHRELAAILEADAPETLDAFAPLAERGRRIGGAPALPTEAIGAAAWADRAEEIDGLVAAGTEYQRLADHLADRFREDAWATDVGELRALFDALPAGFPAEAFRSVARLLPLLPKLRQEAERLAGLLNQSVPATPEGIDRLVRIAERVVVAPPASPAAVTADVWETGVDRAGDLAAAVAALDAARQAIGTAFTDAAWSLDLAPARAELAARGSGLLRFLSGAWRQADRTVKSVLTRPEMPLADVLPLLDALARGQAARRIVIAEDAFGRTAFAEDWRGDRSASGPLLALVDWMRSLRGLDATPRRLAAEPLDRAAIDASAGRVRALLDEAMPLLNSSWRDAADRTATLFGEATSVGRSELRAVEARLATVHQGDQRCRLLMHEVPPILADRQTALADLVAGQAAARQVAESDPLGREAFAAAWNGLHSDWSMLRAATRWLMANGDLRALLARLEDPAAIAERTARVAAASEDFIRTFDVLLTDLGCDAQGLFQAATGAVPTRHVLERLVKWLAAEEELSLWATYRRRAKRATAFGLRGLIERLHDGRLAPANAVAAFEMSYLEAIFADLVHLHPELGTFDGAQHDQLVCDFAALDRQSIAAAALEVVRAHHRRIPPAAGAPVGPLGTLRSEMARKRGHMPIRQLIQRAAPAVQALKPVFMMSPLSVAQFLPPGALGFDLLVMDEASQIQPIDALGAVARCRQVVVVGDPQQLPPTAFFAKMTGATDEEDDEDAAAVADIESILGLFGARGLPKRMLRWHYRSRHQSLIAVSNRQFYEDKLFIVPSPFTAAAGMGLRFHHIPDGIFETGGSRTNPLEAKIVAEAIVAHARTHPELSLGVAAFSAAQRRAIQDQLEILRRQLPPEQEGFFQAHPSEPFFIKNLENVQGDERDVIFISVGYGPSAPGRRPAMRFGPLGNAGGERRLNVLISRAKRRCDVFASMTDEDIDPDFAATRPGVLAFKLFLHYARTGQLAMAGSTPRGHDSLFEAQVAQALQARGYQVHRQVGIAGFFIDLAVADPDHPGRYLLGIECDGEAYHDARSARDRDRLRQAILEDHGWIIHRIWSTDWFQRPNEQLDRAVAAVDAAREELIRREAARQARAVMAEPVTIDREDAAIEVGVVPLSGPAHARTPYVEAALPLPEGILDLHETPTGRLAAMVCEVVAIEGPVHVDEVTARLRDAWGLRRAGGRIQAAVESAVQAAVSGGRIRQSGPFLSMPDTRPVIRDRAAASPGVRKPEMLPPAEISEAALEIVRASLGATPDQVVQAVARAFGFKATSGQLREVIAAELAAMRARGDLAERNGLLVLPA